MGVANDGVIYGANLTTAVSAGSPYRIYRWPSWNSPGQGAYGGDPTTGSAVDGLRVGDSFAITGSGTNTMIVIGIASKAAFILFSTVDGINFTPTVVTNITGLGTVSGESCPAWRFYHKKQIYGQAKRLHHHLARAVSSRLWHQRRGNRHRAGYVNAAHTFKPEQFLRRPVFLQPRRHPCWASTFTGSSTLPKFLLWDNSTSWNSLFA